MPAGGEFEIHARLYQGDFQRQGGGLRFGPFQRRGLDPAEVPCNLFVLGQLEREGLEQRE